MTKDAPDQNAKNPYPGPAPDLSLGSPQDLWPLLRSGYSLTTVSGSVLSGEATPDFDANEPPVVIAELQDMIATQFNSPEKDIVEAILREEYQVLAIIPATSHPIAKLTVSVQLSGPDDEQNRRVRAHLGFTYQMSSKGGVAEALMPQGTTEKESYDHFREAVRTALATAFKDMEQSRGLPSPF